MLGLFPGSLETCGCMRPAKFIIFGVNAGGLVAVSATSLIGVDSGRDGRM